MSPARSWAARLSASAERDFQNIIAWTQEQFDPAQAVTYADTLSDALEALTEGPTAAGVRDRRDILRGLMTLHVARHGRKARHFVLFRVVGQPDTRRIEVLRVLHDAMDLPRHVG